MGRFGYIETGLNEATENINDRIEALEERRKDLRETTRYYNQRYRSMQAELTELRNKKRRLQRQLAKVEELRAMIKPTPPSQR